MDFNRALKSLEEENLFLKHKLEVQDEEVLVLQKKVEFYENCLDNIGEKIRLEDVLCTLLAKIADEKSKTATENKKIDALITKSNLILDDMTKELADTRVVTATVESIGDLVDAVCDEIMEKMVLELGHDQDP